MLYLSLIVSFVALVVAVLGRNTAREAERIAHERLDNVYRLNLRLVKLEVAAKPRVKTPSNKPS